MFKKTIVFFSLLAIVGGFYTANAQSATSAAATPTARSSPTAQPSPTPTSAPRTCQVNTGFQNGTVNLRACGSTSCAVVDVVTESEKLIILSTSNWTQALNSRGVTGWINSIFCSEVKK